VAEDYSPSDYEFPRLYVSGEESHEYLIAYPERGSYTIARGPRPPPGLWMGLKPYEWGWLRLFDPLQALVTRDFAVVVPWLSYKALYMRAGVRLCLVEVSGIHVNIVAREGEEVGERSILAHVVTGKGETKTLRPGCRGLVVYIAWEPGAEVDRYVYLIAEKDKVTLLDPDEEALKFLAGQ
jgi:hypothetical protein